MKKVIDKNRNGEIVTRLKTVEVVLVHCNLVNNSYDQASKVLFTFVPNKQFGQLIIEIWFKDQNNRPLEIEDNVNITHIIGISYYKNEIFT